MIDLEKWIKKHAGLNLKPYKDNLNKTIIGYGRNIEDNGISRDEADYLFENDLNRCIKELENFSWYVDNSKNIQYALINICFSLGITNLLEFKDMIDCLIKKDYTSASLCVLQSKWAMQVEKRAKDIAVIMREGF